MSENIYCNCNEWKDLKDNNRELFKWDADYGWLLQWIEVTDEKGYTRLHRYGMPISFCPMCGKILKKEVFNVKK